jgi:parvulin-like peptidyl-prolyl isomerase
LIKVVDKKESGVIVYDEIKVNIESHLRQQKVNEQYASYIEELKSKAKVEIAAP